MVIQLPTITLMQGDRIRLQTRTESNVLPTGMILHITKVERAPDGAKVVWLSSQPPTKEDLTFDLR